MDSDNLPSLEKLIAAILAGDERSQQLLYEQCNPRFQPFARKLLIRKGCCAPDQDSFEVTNSAWSNIFINLSGLRNHNKFVPWALRIIRNKAFEHLQQCIKTQLNEVSLHSLNKKASDESQEKEIAFDSASIVDADTVIYHSLLADEILNLAREISTELHDILYLQMTEDLPLPAIARRLGKSYGSTRTIRSRGIRELKGRLAEKKKVLKKKLTRKRTDTEE